MPTSRKTFEVDVLTFLSELDPPAKRFLDIGAGAGKYGRIIKNQLMQPTVAHAVEVNPLYIVEYKLKEFYDEVFCIDAATIPRDNKLEFYDVAILGDVIEHLCKSDGIDLVDYLIYRTRYVIVVYPQLYLQISQTPSENHRSLWSLENFPLEYLQDHQIKEGKELVILRGFLATPGVIITDEAKSLLKN